MDDDDNDSHFVGIHGFKSPGTFLSTSVIGLPSFQGFRFFSLFSLLS